MTGEPEATRSAGHEAYWLVGHPHDVPGGDDWLSDNERRAQQRYRVPSRRTQWRLGRATAKRVLRAWVDDGRHAIAPAGGVDGRAAVASPSQIGIVPRGREDGVPVVEGLGAAPPALSLSHCATMALAAVADPGVALGVDLERVEGRSATFAADWFAPSSLERIRRAGPGRHDQLVTLTWSVTEAALKSVGLGLRIDTREVTVRTTDPVPGGCGWGRADAVVAGRAEVRGWWRPLLGHVVVVVGDGDALARPPSRIWPSSPTTALATSATTARSGGMRSAGGARTRDGEPRRT